MKVGQWNAAHTAQLVDQTNPVKSAPQYSRLPMTQRVTVRSNAESMTVRNDDMRALALAAAPTDAIGPLATMYSSFESQGYTYATYVLVWYK